MKIAIKSAIFAAVLCVGAAAALIGYWFVHENQQPGKFGRNIEFRLLAVNRESGSGISGAPDANNGEGFSGADAQKWIAGGDAPTGWKWLPVGESLQAETMAGLGASEISRSNDGREFLLVGDSDEMALTHRTGAPSWGIKSAETHSGQSGPGVAIILDRAGGDLMYQFTQKRTGQWLALIVNDRILMVAKIVTPMKDALDVSLPQGQLREAVELRNVLLSGGS